MQQGRRSKGPRMHQVLIGVFSVVLAILFYWLVGFFLRDIGTLRGPFYPDVERQFLSQDLVKQQRDLSEQIAQMGQKIADHRERQRILRDSTNSSQQTMNQLLEFQKMNLQKDVKPSPEEQQALAESQKVFLSNQTRYQALNEQIAQWNEEQKTLEAKIKEIESALEKQRVPAREEFQRLRRQHDIKVASLKLCVVIPLLLVALYLFLLKRGTIYGPIIYATGIALVIHTGIIIHDYFPERYFKYIVVLVALAVVFQILVYLLRMIAHPRKDWLLKQYREAYERFLCPVCGYPIRRGPMKYTFWNRRTIRKLTIPESVPAGEKEETYTCPACGARVYEECPSCHAVRHSLLPSCEKCGAAKEFA